MRACGKGRAARAERLVATIVEVQECLAAEQGVVEPFAGIEPGVVAGARDDDSADVQVAAGPPRAPPAMRSARWETRPTPSSPRRGTTTATERHLRTGASERGGIEIPFSARLLMHE